MALTYAKAKHLRELSSLEGVMSILAIDHRGNLMADMQKARDKTVSDADVTVFKQAVISHLIEEATGVLTDPDFGFEAVLNTNAAMIAPLEVTDYSPHPSQRMTTMIEGWNVEKIKTNGASGVKLLLYYHPDAPNAASQTTLVDSIVEQCAIADIPFFLEPMSYSLDASRTLSNDEKRDVVIATAQHFSAHGVDVLKLEFPQTQTENQTLWVQALHDLNAVCTVPWTLLSGGVSFEVFTQQATLACQAGASGVMVGRAVWAEAVGLEGAALTDFLRTTGVARMRLLTSICRMYGNDYRSRVGTPDVGMGWYKGSNQ